MIMRDYFLEGNVKRPFYELCPDMSKFIYCSNWDAHEMDKVDYCQIVTSTQLRNDLIKHRCWSPFGIFPGEIKRTLLHWYEACKWIVKREFKIFIFWFTY